MPRYGGLEHAFLDRAGNVQGGMEAKAFTSQEDAQAWANELASVPVSADDGTWPLDRPESELWVRLPDVTVAGKAKTRIVRVTGVPTATEIAGKADQAAVDTALAGKADAQATSDALATKANASSLAAKADKIYVDGALTGKADATALSAKADKSYVDTALGAKLDTSAANSTFAAVSPTGRDKLQAANAGKMKTWRAALANRDNAAAKVLCIGDSITEGQGATSPSSPWASQLKRALAGMFPVAGAYAARNYRPAAKGQTTFTSEWVTSGSPSLVLDYGLAHFGYQMSGGQTLTLTVTGTSVGIAYVKGSAIGSWSYSVDGAAAVTVNAAAGTTSDGWVQTITFPARGTHTVTIAVVSGIALITGAFIYDGDEAKGVQVVNAGHSGSTSKSWTSTWSTARLSEAVAQYAPHLVTIGLGANDYNGANGITPAQYGTNLQTLIDLINAAITVDPSIVLIGYPKRGDYTNPTYAWTDYLAQMRAVADANPNVTMLDLSLRMVDGTDTALGLYADQLHPSDKGHAYIGDAVAGFLAQDVGRGAVVPSISKGQAQPAAARPGLYYGSAVQTLATFAFGLNNLKVSPVAIPRSGTLDRIACEVTTPAAGGSVRLFVYDDEDGAPGNLVLDAGTVDASTAGVKEVTVSQAVTAGVYWGGTVSVGSADVTLRALSGINPAVGMVSATAGLAPAGFQGAFSGSLPARWPALANAGTMAPRVMVRMA